MRSESFSDSLNATWPDGINVDWSFQYRVSSAHGTYPIATPNPSSDGACIVGVPVMRKPLINDCSAWRPDEVVPNPVSKNTGSVATA